MSRWTLAILLTFALTLTISSSEEATDGGATCKCGGKYASGRTIDGCHDGTCPIHYSVRCVTIYQASTPGVIIGYDCVPWPAGVSDCATFDDGSRLCVAKDSCQKDSDSCLGSSEKSHAKLNLQLNPSGLDFLIDAIREYARSRVPNLRIPTQSIVQSKINVTMSNIVVSNFVPPDLHYSLEPPSTISLTAKGGDFKACAKWNAFWTMASFIGADGDLCAWSLNQRGIDASLKIDLSISKMGDVHLETRECHFDAPLDMNFAGSLLGSLANMAKGAIQDKIKDELSKHFCDELARLVNGFLLETPKSVKLFDGYQLSYKVDRVSVDQRGLSVSTSMNASYV